MAILLIAVSFLITLIAIKINNQQTDCIRSAFIKTSVIYGVIIAVITEVLSFAKSLSFSYILLWWATLAVINSLFLTKVLFYHKKSINMIRLKNQLMNYCKKHNLINIIAIAGFILIISISLLTALFVLPHNYDSMTYHLPRVMHWIQNRSVAHYPTHNLRQISFPPGASYIVTHFQILSGGDRFANCVQWFGFFGSAIGTSLIVKHLGRSQAQAITALVCVSIPMAIMQSTTPQTDLVTSFWLVCFAYFIFRKPIYAKSDYFWLSAAFGLAILTKPTGIIFGVPLLAVLGLRIIANHLSSQNLGKRIFHSIIFTGLVLLGSISLSLPSYWRNLQTFGNFLGIDTGTRNETIGLIPLVSNFLRNVALNLPLAAFWQLVETIHQYVLKIDVNYLGTSLKGETPFDFNYFWLLLTLPDENYVGNPVHLILLLAAMLTFMLYLRQNRQLSAVLLLALANSTGFFLFCLLLKWQEWGNRLLLPFFILSSPIIGYFISRFLFDSLQRILASLLIFMAVLYSINPLYTLSESFEISFYDLGRIEYRLQTNPEDAYFRRAGILLKKDYLKLIDRSVKDNCYTVGLNSGADDWEYPIWALMSAKNPQFKMKHINVENESKKMLSEFPNSELCAIFKIRGASTNYLKISAQHN